MCGLRGREPLFLCDITVQVSKRTSSCESTLYFRSHLCGLTLLSCLEPRNQLCLAGHNLHSSWGVKPHVLPSLKNIFLSSLTLFSPPSPLHLSTKHVTVLSSPNKQTSLYMRVNKGRSTNRELLSPLFLLLCLALCHLTDDIMCFFITQSPTVHTPVLQQ